MMYLVPTALLDTFPPHPFSALQPQWSPGWLHLNLVTSTKIPLSRAHSQVLGEYKFGGGGNPAQSPLSFYIYWVPVLLQPHLMPTFPRGFILFLKHVMALSPLALAHLTLRRSLYCMLFLSVYCLLDISSANIFLGQVTPFYALLEPLSLPLWHLLSL